MAPSSRLPTARRTMRAATDAATEAEAVAAAEEEEEAAVAEEEDAAAAEEEMVVAAEAAAAAAAAESEADAAEVAAEPGRPLGHGVSPAGRCAHGYSACTSGHVKASTRAPAARHGPGSG